MTHNLFESRQKLTTAAGATGHYYALAALERAGLGKISRLPVSTPHRARERSAQLRRQEGHGGAHPPTRRLEAQCDADRRDSVRRRARRAAGFHRRPAALRPRGDARRCRAHGQEPQAHRAAGACGPGRRPLGAGRPLRYARRARSQHEDRVPAQRRALQVHEVGHAGLRHVQGRATGHRHRAPGQPRIPRARRARARRRLLSRLAGRHRLAHDHDQRHRRRRLGCGRHRGGGRRCWASPCTS